MQFLKSITVFPTEVQKRIHIIALQQTPVDVSLANTNGVDSTLLESCRTYHRFIMSMLSDMYENPLEYGMNAGEYDAFLNGKKENAMKQKFPSKTLELRSKTYNCVSGYFRLLMLLAITGKPNLNRMTVHVSEYDKIRKEFDRNLNSKKKTKSNDIPYQTRIDALKRIGFIITETNSGAVISSEKFSNMFMAMSALAKTIPNVKTYGEHNFFNCDFRQIFSKHKPDYKDVVQTLDDEKRKVVDEIHNYAKTCKLTVSITTYWKLNYLYKGKHVICIDTEGNNFRIRVDSFEKDKYLAKIEEQGEEFKKYFIRHLNYCTACSTSHLGGFADVFGKRKRLCCYATPSFRITNPQIEDVENIIKFIDFRREAILLEKRGK